MEEDETIATVASSSASTSEKKKGKRPRDEGEDARGDRAGGVSPTRTIPSLENSLSFSDTLIALHMMRAQFPLINKSLKKEQVIRIFKLSTGQDDHAILFKEDYLSQIQVAIERLNINGQSNDLEVFDWFKAHVIDCKLDVSIHHLELCSLLSIGGNLRDEHISLLINAGLLTRQLGDSDMYWFAIPNIGFILKGLSQGRKELLSFLNRKKYKEMSLASLEKRRLRTSLMDMRFHLRDLIGSGHLKTYNAPTGVVVCVSID